jgi:hypothetical protein
MSSGNASIRKFINKKFKKICAEAGLKFYEAMLKDDRAALKNI